MQPQPERPAVKPLEAYEPGFVHIDVKYLLVLDGEPRRYLFVAIDRASRWVYVGLKADRIARSPKGLVQTAPFYLQKRRQRLRQIRRKRILTALRVLQGRTPGRGECFTDCYLRRARPIEHLLILPHHPHGREAKGTASGGPAGQTPGKGRVDQR